MSAGLLCDCTRHEHPVGRIVGVGGCPKYSADQDAGGPCAACGPSLRQCGATDCTNVGTARPVLVVRAWIGEAGVDMELQLPVCADHQALVTVGEFLTDDGWVLCRQGYIAARGPDTPPLRGLTSLGWHPMAEAVR